MKTFPVIWPYEREQVRELERLGAPRHVPRGLVEPHARQAMRNHSQSLDELARRGGLALNELCAVLADRSVYDPEFLRMTNAVAVERVQAAIREFEAQS